MEEEGSDWAQHCLLIGSEAWHLQDGEQALHERTLGACEAQAFQDPKL